MLSMVYKYVWMYLATGLVATIIWVAAATAYTMCRFYKINKSPSREELDDFLDDFHCIMWGLPSRNLARSVARDLENNKRKRVMLLVTSYLAWPVNITMGASRLPELNEYFDDLKKS